MGTTTKTGDVMERMILPALKHGGYTWQRHVRIGNRPCGKAHYVDAIATKDYLILLSSKWQEVSGTAECKIPYEVICLIAAMADPKYSRCYLVLGGPGWTLREWYVSGGLTQFIRNTDKVNIITLEQFVALANQGKL